MKAFPTIHLGGTTAPQLLDDYGKAYEALLAAREAFDKIEFNSRDYLPHGNHTSVPFAGTQEWQAAVEWRERITQSLVDIEEYLLNHIESIHEQNH
jgi:hypothetical protein